MVAPQRTQQSAGSIAAGGGSPTWTRALAIFASSFLLYALLPSRNWNYADDSLSWAYRITTTRGLINVHHLFFNALRLVYHGLSLVPGVSVDPARLLSLYCALFGAAGLVFLDALLRLAGLGRVALLGTLACAFTAGWWAYCIVGDVYVPATACMVAAAYFLCRGMQPGEPRVRNGALAALSLVLMMLHHQAYFVFAAGLVPGTLLTRALDRKRFAYSLAVVVAAGAVVLSIYGAIYVNSGTRGSLRQFLSGYAGESDWRPDQMRISPSTLIGAAAGECRAIVSTNVLFRSAELTRRIQARYPYRNVYPYPYLVRHLPMPAVGLVGLGIAIALLIGIPLAIRGLWFGFRGRDVLAVIFTASVFQALFFVWWEAISDEFWIWSLPVVALAVAAGAAAFGRRDRALLGLVAGGLCVSTFVGSIVPYADPANDIDAVNARYIGRVGSRDLLVGFDEIQNWHRVLLAQERQGFRYFNILGQAEQWSEKDVQALDRAIADALERKGRVFIGPYVLTPPVSNLVTLRLINPSFDGQRRAVIATLARLDPASVVWIPAAVTLPGYFLDAQAPAPAGGAGRSRR